MVWVASPWQHVLRSTEPGGAKSAEIVAARNEYEPLWVIIHAGAQALANVRVEASVLTGPAGQIEVGPRSGRERFSRKHPTCLHLSSIDSFVQIR